MILSAFLAVLAALIPVYFWYVIIIRKHREGMKFFFFLVFTLSALFALGFSFVETDLLSFFKTIVGVFFGFVLVGVVLEYGKNIILRLFAKNFFKNIDDVVDLAFATALGFTFMENILIFYELFQLSFSFGSPVDIMKKMVVQELFILPIHLVSSGIFGYYYGLSLFANETLKKQKFFSAKQILTGTILSTLFYGIFFFLKEQNYSIVDLGDFIGIYGIPEILGENLLPLISYVFFSFGSLFLFYKLQQKHFLTDMGGEKK